MPQPSINQGMEIVQQVPGNRPPLFGNATIGLGQLEHIDYDGTILPITTYIEEILGIFPQAMQSIMAYSSNVALCKGGLLINESSNIIICSYIEKLGKGSHLNNQDK